MDLTKVNGCYSKELRESTYIIKLMVKEDSISVSDMINTVKAIIMSAYIEADAKKRFTKKLEACKTKEEIDRLCYDAVVHGMYYHGSNKRKSVA